MIDGLIKLSDIKMPERVEQPQPVEYFTAEYSASQNCFHVDSLAHVLQINRKNALIKNSVDYQIIAICGSDDEAMDYCRKFKQQQKAAWTRTHTDHSICSEGEGACLS